MKRIFNEDVIKVIKYSVKYLKYQRVQFIFTPILTMIFAVPPFLIKYFIDNIISQGRDSSVLLFSLFFVLVVGCQSIIYLIVNYYGWKIPNLITRDEQISLFQKIQRIPVTRFSQVTTGDLMARVLSDVPEMALVIGTAIPAIFWNFIGLIITGGVLVYFNWRLALITFATLPFYCLTIDLLHHKMESSSKEERIAYGKMTEEFREKVEGIWAIKGLVKYDFFTRVFTKNVNDWVKKKNKYHFNAQSAETLINFVSSITPVFVLGYGGFETMRGNMTLGTLMGFYSYMNWIYYPIRGISMHLVNLLRVGQVAKRIFEIYEVQEENRGGKEKFPKIYPIYYKDVIFSYNSSPVLERINLNIAQGCKIAIVGTSGAGKSTLVNLIPRFYEPKKGNVMINEKSIEVYILDDLRKNIQIVHETDYLFNMSVRENILLDETFSDEEFQQAMRISRVDKFINSLENGYDTIAGERGSNLSDGQKQRIAIARAVIRKPKILIFDEATSGVDSQTEDEIFEELRKLDMTLIIISHRLSTIRKTDKVVVLYEGRVLAEGKHEELLTRCPEYKNIIASQLIM